MSFVLEVSVPKSWWDEKSVQREIARTLKKETGKKIRTDFNATTRGWRRQNKEGQKIKPTFKNKFEKTSSRMSIKVSTKDAVYAYVNYGTDSRIIFPKPSRVSRSGGPPRLAYQQGYNPATSRGSVSSKRATRSGPVVYRPYAVHHGIEAREFDDTISKRQRVPFGLDITAAIYRGMTR